MVYYILLLLFFLQSLYQLPSQEASDNMSLTQAPLLMCLVLIPYFLHCQLHVCPGDTPGGERSWDCWRGLQTSEDQRGGSLGWSLSLFLIDYLGLGGDQFWIPRKTRLLSLQSQGGGPPASPGSPIASREKDALW